MLRGHLRGLCRLRCHDGPAGRRLLAESPTGADRRASGAYPAPPVNPRPPRRYDEHGHELRPVRYDK